VNPIAKTDSTGATRSLVAHCVDVALSAKAIVSKPVLRARLSHAAGIALEDVHAERLAVLAGLHDAGKALAGFQERITGHGHGTSHLAELLAVLKADQDTQRALRLDLLAQWFDNPAAAIFTSVCHHGSPVALQAIQQHLAHVPAYLSTTVLGHDPCSEIRNLVGTLLAYFPDAQDDAPRLSMRPTFQHLLAGVIMIADWLGSSLPVLGDDYRPSDVAEILNRTAWSDWYSGAAPQAVLGPFQPMGAQTVIGSVSTTENLVIIEAPTGTGKTEAALIHAMRLVEAGKVDGMYFAVPTRAAATELHNRVAELVTRIHPLLKGRVVRAVPGMLETDPWQGGATTWALASPKRTFAAPIAVGTIDQAMMSALRTRHAWMRHALLSRHLLVIDEVHASDPYMMSIVYSLVRRHIDLGGYVLAMSATLGERIRAVLEGRPIQAFNESVDKPYPVVQAGKRFISFAASVRTTKIQLTTRGDALAAAREAVAKGGCALVIRSTVDSAIETYSSLAKDGVPAMLHHSRYADHDRRLLDDRIVSTLGKFGTREPMLVIATQTAEQSLDIDADLLVSDPCPADVLLQRLGRLYRHRPGVPNAYVIAPDDISTVVPVVLRLLDNKATKMPGGYEWAYVYQNLLSVHETLAWLRKHGSIRVPQDSRPLVESTTHPMHLATVAEHLGGAWNTLWQKLYGRDVAQRQAGQSGLIDWSRPYENALVDEYLPTRLGGGKVTVAFEKRDTLKSPFDGALIDALPVPARWLHGVEPETYAEIRSAENNVYRLRVGSLAITYSELGLQKC
jgi:CRISPR-associated endonuclease/helicase Cas3